MPSPTDSSAWQALQAHSEQFKRSDFRLSGLFTADNKRFEHHSLKHENLLLDYSKNYLDDQTLDLLVELAQQQAVPAAIAAMFAGDAINNSEQRPALHVALREPAKSNRFAEVTTALQRMQTLVEDVHAGRRVGYNGDPITDVVNLGVGGSDLGPALAADALKPFATGQIRAHFVSNIDPTHIHDTLAALNPATTLFIVSSKSFTTQETLHNAEAARAWLQAHGQNAKQCSGHFIAVTANIEVAVQFGIDLSDVLPLWEWVGGRYSLCSAIGLPVALLIGMQQFRQLLDGAHAMDLHFRDAQLHANLPVIMALLSVWYRGFFASHSCAVIPYSQRLNLLPGYLQQLHMESLGKQVDKNHQAVKIATGEPLWGAVGSDVQHSCFQLLHQGTELIPVDFIAIARAENNTNAINHQHLLANCFSQAMALMQGAVDEQAPYRALTGNKPSNTLLLSQLNPYNLGSLLALYEHKVYVQSVIWNINAFDQWGVELGKQLTSPIFAALNSDEQHAELDSSTAGLVRSVRDWSR